jgi:DNA-directed RNA polymerase specialized sigma subunit
MKNYMNSDYAVNKNARGIIYRFADIIVEITLEIYLRENPDKTENDFVELKTLSDSIYLEQDREEYRQTYRNVSIHGLDETEICSVPSPEDEVIERQQEAMKQKHQRRLAKQALTTLTEVQHRRYLLYHVNGLTMREIAKIEGVIHSKIQKSLEASEKKIKKFLSDH